MKIAPYLNISIDGQNTIYCSTFQLAWNELMDGYARGPVELLNQQSPIMNMVAHLNRQEFNKNQLPEECYLAMGGLIKDDIITDIKKALADKFQEQSKIEFKSRDPLGIITYAFLLKNIHFIENFAELPNSMNFGGTPVNGFGTLESNPIGRNTVEILYYLNPDNFAVHLRCKEDNDELVLARINQQKTLADTVKEVESRTTKFTPTKMTLEDSIAIPVIDFDIEHHFNEMVGQQLSGNLLGMYIEDAVQFIKFNLNAEGAILRSEAALSTYRCIAKKNKIMLFDGPFLIYMKQKGQRNPYFAMWVQDKKLLQKS